MTAAAQEKHNYRSQGRWALKHRSRRENVGDALRLPGWTCLLAAITAAGVYMSLPRDVPRVLAYTRLVISSIVVDWWGVVSALFAVGAICLIVGRSLSRLPVHRGRVPLTIATILIVVAATIGTAWVGLWELFTDFHVLAAQSEGGCRIAIREGIGGGEVGIVQPGSYLIDWVEASYGADDGYTPFAHGTYSLIWVGETADISIWGPPVTPTSWYTEPQLHCNQ